MTGRAPDVAGPVVTVRAVRAASVDWSAIRDLCCRTGNAGDPIDASRWPFFAEVWIGPYQRLAPEWTYVADGGDRVVGYLTGCPDTRAFRRRRVAFALPLLVRLVLGRYAWNADTRRVVRRALGLERGPEDALRARGPRGFEASFPAHLHMNVDAGFRNRGVGAALLARFVEDLERRGVPGLHLFCGTAPKAFYVRHGFEELAALEFRPGAWVHLLGRRLAQGAPLR